MPYGSQGAFALEVVDIWTSPLSLGARAPASRNYQALPPALAL